MDVGLFPQLPSAASDLQKIISRLVDLGRRVGALEAARTVITQINGGVITTGTINGASIATGTITATQIQAGSITTATLAAGSVTASIIAANAVTATAIAADSINSGHIVAGTIQASDIQSHTITALQIAAGTITATEILAGTITAVQIAANTITANKIAAGTITATEIASATITGGLIAATTITAANIASGTITSTQLAANSVTATQIVTGAVTSTKISVSDLSAISANLGTITAGTITGATVQTAATGSRVVLNTGGITAYNASNTPVLAFDTATGSLTLTGTVNANASSVLPVTAFTGGVIGSGNLVQDGGFEDSALSLWANNNLAALTSTTVHVRSGTRAGSITVAAADYPAAVLAAGATYHWKFAEPSGTTAASDATANNGTYTGTYTLNQTGLGPSGGAAVLFDGSTAEVTTSVQVNPNTLTALTISIGFKTTTTSGGALIGLIDAQTGAGSQHDRAIWMDNTGKIKFGVWTGSPTIVASTASYNDGNKHVVHAVLQANWNMLLYVDGALVASNSNTTAPSAYSGPTTGWWRIGRTSSFSGWDTVGSTFFAGTLDEPAIWNSALSAGQVATLASSFAGSSGSQLKYSEAVIADSPQLFLKLNETSGTAAINAINSTTYAACVIADDPRLWLRLNEPSGTTAYSWPNTGGNFATIVAGLGTAPSQWLRLDETSGTTAADASGNGRTGTYVGTAAVNQTSLIPGDTGKAVSLPAAAAAVATTYQPFVSGTKRTFAGYMRAASFASGAARWFDGGPMYLRSEGPATIRLSKQSQAWSGTWGIAGSFQTNTTFHWAMVVDESIAGTSGGGTAELFINGVSQGVLNPTLQWGTNANISWNSQAGEHMDATYDEVMVFEDALTPAQIRQLAGFALFGTYSGVTLNQTGLIAGDADKAVTVPNSGSIATNYQPFPLATETKTYEIIAQRTNTTDGDTLFGQTGGSGGYSLAILAGSNDVRLTNYSGSTGTWTNAWPGIGVPVHVAMIHNATTNIAELFINGISQGTKTGLTNAGSNNTATVGTDSQGSGTFNGQLDEFAVYSGALSATRIAAHAAFVVSGAYGAGVTLNQTGATGDGDKAASFNNTATAVVTTSIAPFSSLQPSLTIEGIFKRTATTDADALFQSNGTQRVYLRLEAGNNDVRFDANHAAGTSVTWAGAWPGTGTFVHWAVTINRTANTVELFINGNSQGTIGSIEAYGALPGVLSIGDNSGIAGFTNGVMDNFAVYNSILTASKIASHASGIPLAANVLANMSIIPVAAGQALVQPGATHTAQAYFKAATVSRTVRVNIAWYTSASAFISQSTSAATTVDNTSSFTRTTLTATAPATAAYARVIPEVVGIFSGETHYVDDVALTRGDIAADIPTIANNTIVGGMVLADQITAREIAASSITSVEILANTITAGNIAAGTITATQIATGTITATQLSATAIDAMVITGATVRTSASTQVNQVILDSAGLRAYGDKLTVPTGLVASIRTDLLPWQLAPGTFYYKVSAVNAQGETTVSSEVSQAVTGVGNETIQITFNPVPGASEYKVWRGTSSNGQTGYLANSYPTIDPEATAPYIVADIGSAITASALPGSNTAITVPLNVTTTGLGTITGALYRSSEVHPRTQINTAGLALTDSLGARVWSLSTLAGLASRQRATVPFGNTTKQIVFLEDGTTTPRGAIGSYTATNLSTAAPADLGIYADGNSTTVQSKLVIGATQQRGGNGSMFTITGATSTLTGGFFLRSGAPSQFGYRTLLGGPGGYRDSDFGVTVYRNSGTTSTTLTMNGIIGGYEAGAYLAWVYVTGANRSAYTLALVSMPSESNLFPGINTILDGAFTTGPANTSITASNGSTGNGWGLIGGGSSNGLLITIDPNGVSCSWYIRVMRLSALPSSEILTSF